MIGDPADSGTDLDWAPWPPKPGNAGLVVSWTVDAMPPDVGSCQAEDLSSVELYFVHPSVDQRAWTSSYLRSECAEGQIRLEPREGLAPGRYRFELSLVRSSGDLFDHKPTGEVALIDGDVTTLAVIDVSRATLSN